MNKSDPPTAGFPAKLSWDDWHRGDRHDCRCIPVPAPTAPRRERRKHARLMAKIDRLIARLRRDL